MTSDSHSKTAQTAVQSPQDSSVGSPQVESRSVPNAPAGSSYEAAGTSSRAPETSGVPTNTRQPSTAAPPVPFHRRTRASQGTRRAGWAEAQELRRALVPKMTLQEAGRRLGMTKQSADQLELVALAKILRHPSVVSMKREVIGMK